MIKMVSGVGRQSLAYRKYAIILRMTNNAVTLSAQTPKKTSWG